MIRNNTERDIILLVLQIMLMGKYGNLFHHRLVGIHIKERRNVLADYGKTLQSHTGIDVFLNQIRVMAVPIVVELREHNIPYLNKTVSFTAHHVFRSGSVLFSTVVVNLRAGTAGTGTMLPEIVFFSKTVHTLSRNTELFRPNTEGLFIVQINTRIKTILRNPYPFRKELPGKVQRLRLKIISEGEIPEHLKKSTVTCRFTDVFNVSGTNTFLTGGNSSPRRNLLSGKVRLQRRHT